MDGAVGVLDPAVVDEPTGPSWSSRTPPMHGVGGDGAHRGVRRGPASPPPPGVRRAGRARPGLPDRRVPQPGGARARWTSCWRWPAGAAPTSPSPTTRTPTGARWPIPTPRRRLADAARRRGRRAARRPPDAARGARAATPPRSCRRRCCAAICAARGLAYARDADRLQVDRRGPARGPTWSYGYEEALGYCVAPGARAGQGRHHRRPAGRRAGRRAQGGAAHARPTGWTSWPREFGVYATDQLSVRVDDLAAIDDAMAQLRRTPPDVAARRAGHRFEDLLPGRRRGHPTDRLDPGRGSAFRHRAEAQGVPGGRGAGGRRRRDHSAGASGRRPGRAAHRGRRRARPCSSPVTHRAPQEPRHVVRSRSYDGDRLWLPSTQGGTMTEATSYRSSLTLDRPLRAVGQVDSRALAHDPAAPAQPRSSSAGCGTPTSWRSTSKAAWSAHTETAATALGLQRQHRLLASFCSNSIEPPGGSRLGAPLALRSGRRASSPCRAVSARRSPAARLRPWRCSSRECRSVSLSRRRSPVPSRRCSAGAPDARYHAPGSGTQLRLDPHVARLRRSCRAERGARLAGMLSPFVVMMGDALGLFVD